MWLFQWGPSGGSQPPMSPTILASWDSHLLTLNSTDCVITRTLWKWQSAFQAHAGHKQCVHRRGIAPLCGDYVWDEALNSLCGSAAVGFLFSCTGNLAEITHLETLSWCKDYSLQDGNEVHWSLSLIQHCTYQNSLPCEPRLGPEGRIRCLLLKWWKRMWWHRGKAFKKIFKILPNLGCFFYFFFKFF